MPKTKAKPKRPNPESLPEPLKFATVTKGQVDAIKRVLGNAATIVVSLNDVDVTRGEATLSPSSKCLWTKRGHRITFSMSGGGIVGSCSNERDPYDPKWRDD